MKFVQHPQHNCWMGAPRDWNEERDGPCGALSIHDQRDQRPPKMESVWEPEGMDAVTLALGLGDLRLGIYSSVHPAVSLHVMPKSGKSREDVKTAIYDVIEKLTEYARLNGLAFTVSEDLVNVKEAT